MENRSLSHLSNNVKSFNVVMAILLGLIILFIYSCSSSPAAPQAPPPPSLPVAEVHRASVTTYQQYPASIEGTVNVEIRPQVSGSLDKVFVDEGALVHAGEPLFKINDQPYRAQLNNALASQHGIGAELWSATSYKRLREDALSTERWNRLHPTDPARPIPVTELLARSSGPIVAVTDFMKAVPDQISRWVPDDRTYTSLGTDGFGRSDTRAALRAHFEVDAAAIVAAALRALG